MEWMALLEWAYICLEILPLNAALEGGDLNAFALSCTTFSPTTGKINFKALVVFIWRHSCVFRATVLICLRDKNQCICYHIWAIYYEYVPVVSTDNFIFALIAFEYYLFSWEPASINFMIILIPYTYERWNSLLLGRSMHPVFAIRELLFIKLHTDQCTGSKPFFSSAQSCSTWS